METRCKELSIKSVNHSNVPLNYSELLEKGTDIKIIQELLGHKDIKTTLIYTHVSNKIKKNVRRPLDDLGLFQ